MELGRAFVDDGFLLVFSEAVVGIFRCLFGVKGCGLRFSCRLFRQLRSVVSLLKDVFLSASLSRMLLNCCSY